MANGSLFGDIKSRLGIGNNQDAEYDEYEEYSDEYYEDDYADDGYEGRDPYMDRGTVTTRSGRGRASRMDSSMPRLVTMDDARESARSIPFNRESSSSRSSIRSYGRTMVDSSLPPTMTAEGSAAVSAASNRRAGGIDSLFGGSASGSSAAGSASKASSFGGFSSGSGSLSGSTSSSADILRDSMQLSMPGQRKLQVIKPVKYDDAEGVTNILKGNDVAILSFGSTDRDLMKRILDFSFGAASALDASVECIANGVFAICRTSPLDDREREDLHSMGII